MKTIPDFLVSKELSRVEPAQAGGDLLPEPSVVIEIVFDKLLDVLIRAAPVFRRHTVEFRLRGRLTPAVDLQFQRPPGRDIIQMLPVPSSSTIAILPPAADQPSRSYAARP